MNLDRQTSQKLKKYAQVFKDARDRDANESDTVMYLIKFFEDVLGYDSLAGEISKEVAIKDRYCDFGIKLDGEMPFLVEAKASGNKVLRDKDIEQAENYASRVGLRWVLLTNGIEWKMFHLSFNENDGINHDEIFSINLVDDIDSKPERIWDSLGLLSKDSMKKDLIEDLLNQKKALAPSSLIRVLFSEPVMIVLRRELNRESTIRLEVKDIFEAIKNVISKDALIEAGDIGMKKRRKKRKKKDPDNTTNDSDVEVSDENEDDKSANPGEDNVDDNNIIGERQDRG